jgi:hypothetical protein
MLPRLHGDLSVGKATFTATSPLVGILDTAAIDVVMLRNVDNYIASDTI